MRILGIESSCDETGIAIFDSEQGLLQNLLHSQADLHRQFGGVVPELASRDHIRKALPMITRALDAIDGGVCGHDGTRNIDGIAYTAGPGLIGALLVGASLARGLGLAWNVPVLGVHHMEGHLLAPLLPLPDAPPPPTFPMVALLVSGGHTMLVNVAEVGNYEILGESVDDAAGEAFDKTAKLLGLGYPGGPAVAARAADGTAGRFVFPRPMIDRPGLDFSFSGLKTHVLTTVRSLEQTTGTLSDQDINDIALAFETAVAETLVIKCRRAMEQTGHRTLVVAGGVGANQRLRTQLAATLGRRGIAVICPPPALCTDNGAMIAYAGYRRLAAGLTDAAPTTIHATARWPLDSLPAING